MFKKITHLVMVPLMLYPVLLFAQAKKETIVFASGTEGYKSFRIPAIIGLKSKLLLAFCEGRVDGASDFGNICVVMKTSADRGKTWSKLQVVASYGGLQAGNPAPVVDYTDPAFPQGRIFIFYNTGNKSEAEIKRGLGYKEVWYKTSVDEGKTWSEPVNITAQVDKLLKPEINPAYNFSEDWRYYANTPGHAIQIENGIYAGRIYIGANHSAGNPQPHFTEYKAHGFYTDDHGKTFHLSKDVHIPGSNENMAVELNDNKLMLNIRNQRGDIRARIIAKSSDGGINWDTTYFDQNLPDPVCQGSILRIGQYKGKAVLAFVNCADVSKRDNLTLRISYDEGDSWTKKISIAKNDKEADKQRMDYTAYSDIVKLSKRKIGILYEKEEYSKIVFTISKW